MKRVLITIWLRTNVSFALFNGLVCETHWKPQTTNLAKANVVVPWWPLPEEDIM